MALVYGCGAPLGVVPQTLVERLPPADWEPTDPSGEELVSELVRRAQTQTCAVHALVATRSRLYGPATESLIARVDDVARLLCEHGIDRLSIGWGADGVARLLPSQDVVQYDDVMIITGPLDHVYRHSGTHGREGVACGGRVALNPDLTVFVADAPGARIFLESEDEHAFVWTRSPSGRDECSYRSDDGLRPGFETYDAGGIRFLAIEGGEHRIWVGSTGSESHEWALRIEDAWSEGASSQTWTPGTGSRVEVPIQVGPYSIAAPSNGHQYCSGFVAATPTVEIFIPRDAHGLIGVESDSDPVLYLEGPDGAVLCNDDYNGLDPGVSSYFTAGLWQVYVGSFSQGEQFSATLMLN